MEVVEPICFRASGLFSRKCFRRNAVLLANERESMFGRHYRSCLVPARRKGVVYSRLENEPDRTQRNRQVARRLSAADCSILEAVTEMTKLQVGGGIFSTAT